MTALDVAREYLPTLSDDELDHVLWTYTGFPEFFVRWPGEATIEPALRRQLKAYELEGFPELKPAEFVEFFCRAMRCEPGDQVTRIEYRFTPVQVAMFEESA